MAEKIVILGGTKLRPCELGTDRRMDVIRRRIWGMYHDKFIGPNLKKLVPRRIMDVIENVCRGGGR